MASEGFTALAMISALVIVAVFTGLIWAAVQDGRDERARHR
jgi:type II secretory pathway component PulJ